MEHGVSAAGVLIESNWFLDFRRWKIPLMLDRILEPEVMDSHDEALEYDAMDHREVNTGFVTDLLQAGLAELCRESEEPVTVLDIGTGTALIPIELCQREPNVRVLAIDLALSMLDVARGNVEIAALRDRIMLDRVDAKSLDYEAEQFACVISNSIIHHSPVPERVLGEALRVLQPGGLLFIRDLARPETDAELQRLVQTHAAEDTPPQQQMLADSLRAALTVDEVRALLAPWQVPPTTVTMTSDRHWTWSYRKPD